MRGTAASSPLVLVPVGHVGTFSGGSNCVSVRIRWNDHHFGSNLMIAGCQFVEANSDRQRVTQSQMNTFETTFKDESWCYLTKMTLAGCLNKNFSGKKMVDSFEAKRVITLHHGPCLLGVIIITCCVIFNKKKKINLCECCGSRFVRCRPLNSSWRRQSSQETKSTKQQRAGTVHQSTTLFGFIFF